MLNHNSKVWIVNYACAIDYYLDKHKQQRGVLTPGGKGINMAIVMALFGIKPTVLTFLGQPTKDLFLQLLKPYQLDLVSFPATTQTRINVKLLDGAQTTEINDVTPLMEEQAVHEMIAYLKANVKPNDLSVLNGRFLQRDLVKLLDVAFSLTKYVVLDVDEPQLLQLLNQRQPWLMKPNRDEFVAMVNANNSNVDQQELVQLIKQFQTTQNLLMSDGAQGAYFFDQQQLLFMEAIPPQQLVSTTGAGDTLLGVFLANLLLDKDPVGSLKVAVNYASATISKLGVVNSNDQIVLKATNYYYL